MSKKKSKLLKAKSGIRLDIGCGDNKQPGFVGMDFRKLKGVDIVHDAEVLPYPLPDNCCVQVLLSHLVEHICPRKIIPIVNEIWRITKPGGQLLISTPYAGSAGFWQDPSHCHGWTEATAYYFDPHPNVNGLNGHEKFNIVYNVYKPNPWLIIQNDWHPTGNINIQLIKRPLKDAEDYFKSKESK